MLSPALIFTIFAYIFYTHQPTFYKVGVLYEFSYTQENVQKKVIEADEAVATLRTNNLKSGLNFDQQSKLIIFKPGPISLKLEIENPNKDLAQKDLEKSENFLIQKYDLKKIGLGDFKKNYPNVIYPISIITLGFLIGLIVSLVKEYFKKY